MERGYDREGDALTQAVPLDPDHTLEFKAEFIRRERNGVHARVSVLMNGVTLAYDVMNVEQDKERTHLAGRVKRHFSNGMAAVYPEPYLVKDLDLFCYGLYDAYVGADLSEYTGGFETAIPPVQIVRDIAVEDGGTIMFGPPERGKSWALMFMAVAINAGVSGVFQVEKRRVLFINLERSAQSVRNRLGLVNRALGLDATHPIHMLNRRGRTLADIHTAVQRSIAENDIGFICLDSLTRAGLGDLNENLTGNRAIDMMNSYGRGWIAIAHSPRNDDSHVYGTIMQEAGADVMVRCVSQVEPPDLGIALFRTKGTDLPPAAQPQVIALRFGEDGLCGVRLSKLAEFPDLLTAATGNESKPARLKSYMREVGNATATEAAKATGLDRSLVARLFDNADEYVRLTKKGREQPYGLRGNSEPMTVPFD